MLTSHFFSSAAFTRRIIPKWRVSIHFPFYPGKTSGRCANQRIIGGVCCQCFTSNSASRWKHTMYSWMSLLLWFWRQNRFFFCASFFSSLLYFFFLQGLVAVFRALHVLARLVMSLQASISPPPLSLSLSLSLSVSPPSLSPPLSLLCTVCSCINILRSQWVEKSSTPTHSSFLHSTSITMYQRMFCMLHFLCVSVWRNNFPVIPVSVTGFVFLSFPVVFFQWSPKDETLRN